MSERVTVSNNYTFHPKDVNTSTLLGGTFGKHEVEVSASRLIAYLTYRNYPWNEFKMSGLCWYYDQNSFKEEPLFGLMGPWFDDGPMVFREGIYVVNEGDCLAVTDAFLLRIQKYVRSSW